MATQSSIEWTETTWNPVTGCSKVSPGCAHCYAERMAKRLQAMGVRKYGSGFDVAVHGTALEEPFRWTQPRLVFVGGVFKKRTGRVLDGRTWDEMPVITAGVSQERSAAVPDASPCS